MQILFLNYKYITLLDNMFDVLYRKVLTVIPSCTNHLRRQSSVPCVRLLSLSNPYSFLPAPTSICHNYQLVWLNFVLGGEETLFFFIGLVNYRNTNENCCLNLFYLDKIYHSFRFYCTAPYNIIQLAKERGGKRRYYILTWSLLPVFCSKPSSLK